MFKDFQRRLQRDIKKIVDARTLASDTRSGGDLKVSSFFSISKSIFVCSLFLQNDWGSVVVLRNPYKIIVC